MGFNVGMRDTVTQTAPCTHTHIQILIHTYKYTYRLLHILTA
jgi:hypothetical protein